MLIGYGEINRMQRATDGFEKYLGNKVNRIW